jgi:hypothetical protein
MAGGSAKTSKKIKTRFDYRGGNVSTDKLLKLGFELHDKLHDNLEGVQKDRQGRGVAVAATLVLTLSAVLFSPANAAPLGYGRECVP